MKFVAFSVLYASSSSCVNTAREAFRAMAGLVPPLPMAVEKVTSSFTL